MIRFSNGSYRQKTLRRIHSSANLWENKNTQGHKEGESALFMAVLVHETLPGCIQSRRIIRAKFLLAKFKSSVFTVQRPQIHPITCSLLTKQTVVNLVGCKNPVLFITNKSNRAMTAFWSRCLYFCS